MTAFDRIGVFLSNVFFSSFSRFQLQCVVSSTQTHSATNTLDYGCVCVCCCVRVIWFLTNRETRLNGARIPMNKWHFIIFQRIIRLTLPNKIVLWRALLVCITANMIFYFVFIPSDLWPPYKDESADGACTSNRDLSIDVVIEVWTLIRIDATSIHSEFIYLFYWINCQFNRFITLLVTMKLSK